MSTTLTELVQSRDARFDRGPSGAWRLVEVTLHYVLEGTDDDSTARTDVTAGVPSSFAGLIRDEIDLAAEWVDTVSQDGLWRAKVRYVLDDDDQPETGDSNYNFDTTGGTQHITHSLSTTNKYAPTGKTAGDHKQAIAVGPNGPEGVDITVPVYRWSETHYIADASVTATYKGKLFNLTGQVNNASFKGFSAGECLFLGASGSKRGSADWEITLHFAASPNKTGISIGDISSIAKKGWEYLWVEYQAKEDSTAHQKVHVPKAAYVEKVYEEGDFSDLGIGT